VNIGIGFAVPSRTAQAVADQLIRTGRVERGYVGLRLQEITPSIAQALGLRNEEGVLVAFVEPGGPADRAGVRTGDVITRCRDGPVEGSRALSRAVAATKPRTQVPMTVLRNGQTRDLTVAVGQRGDDRQSARATTQDGQDDSSRLGRALSPIPEAARGQLGL